MPFIQPLQWHYPLILRHKFVMMLSLYIKYFNSFLSHSQYLCIIPNIHCTDAAIDSHDKNKAIVCRLQQLQKFV